MLEHDHAREALTSGIYLPPPDEVGLGSLEAALRRAKPALAVEAKLRRAVARGDLDRAPGDELVAAALAAGVLTEEDVTQLEAAEEARNEAIRVDSFDSKEFAKQRR